MVSGEKKHLALLWLCRWLKMIILRDEVQAPPAFSYVYHTSLRAVAVTLADLFGPTSAGCTAKGGVSTSTACPVAVVKAHQPIFLSLDLNLVPTTYYPHGSLTSWSTPFILIGVTSRAITYLGVTYMLCAIGQCGVLWDVHFARARPHEQKWLAT
jgi:hypothetical protein